jgi:RES domain
MADDEIFGPGWTGWESYQLFAESVKKNLRYVREKIANDFLDNVLATCEKRKLLIPREKVYWRARLGCEIEQGTRIFNDEDGGMRIVSDEERPYRRDEMRPISNWQSEGRANPRGIPYLYLASSRETALADVRPWIGSIISVARFKIRRDLNVIDCSQHHSKNAALALIFNRTGSHEDGMWVAIDQAFAKPVNRDDEGREYIPTQIIAELFKCHGFNGIRYKSLLSEACLSG